MHGTDYVIKDELETIMKC